MSISFDWELVERWSTTSAPEYVVKVVAGRPTTNIRGHVQEAAT